MADQRRRKPKNYYVDYTKKPGQARGQNRGGPSGGGGNSKYKETPELSVGQKGFLVTSITGYEVKSYIEMRQLLEDYYQRIYSDDSAGNKSDPTADQQPEILPNNLKSQGDDEVDDLEAELAELRQNNRHFRQVKTKCKNVIFIVMNEECRDIDQDLIVRKMFEDIEESKSQLTRYTFKLFPIMTTFKTSIPGAKEAVASILKDSFSGESKHVYSNKEDIKYFIEIQKRGDFKLDEAQRMKMIEGLADTVTEIKPHWKVDRRDADLILLVVALREVCCVTFLPDYFKLQKYNMIEYYRKHLGEFIDLTGGPTPPEPKVQHSEL